VLGRTAMDIRLLADLTKQQIQRGEINPHDAPGIVKDVDPVAMVLDRQEPLSTEEHVQAIEQFVETHRPEEHVLAIRERMGEPVIMDARTPYKIEQAIEQFGTSAPDAAHRPEGPFEYPTTSGTFENTVVPTKPDDRVKLADTTAVDFDSLFAGVTPHGSPNSNPF
jgi:hypothetical protein